VTFGPRETSAILNVHISANLMFFQTKKKGRALYRNLHCDRFDSFGSPSRANMNVILRQVGLAAAALMMTALYICIPTSIEVASATASACGSASYAGPIGCVLLSGSQWAPSLASMGNLNVYNNGFNLEHFGPDDGYSNQYQCTELAIRYAAVVWGEGRNLAKPENAWINANWDGSAQGMWTVAPYLPVPLQRIPNGTGAPHFGDLIIFSEAEGPGHVGVVVKVHGGRLYFVGQNQASAQPESWIPINSANRASPGGDFSDSLQPEGWLRSSNALFVSTPSTATSPPNAAVGKSYNFHFSASGGKSAYSWSIASGSLPPGLDLSTSGVISGTPTAPTKLGPFTVKVVSGTHSAEASFTIWALGGELAPFAITTPSTSTSPPNAAIGNAYYFHLAVSGGIGGYMWTIASGSLPSGLSMGFNGLISGTPTLESESGTFTAKVVSGSQSLEKSFTISVLGGTSLPTDNLITNDGFQIPQVSQAWATFNAGSTRIHGWVIGGNSVDIVSSGYYNPAVGDQSLDLSGTCNGCSDPRGSISQAVSTVAGQTYTLAWYMAGNLNCGQPVKEMQVDWNGSPIAHDPFTFDTSGHSDQSLGWVREQVQVIAGSTISKVSFSDVTPDKSECGAALGSVTLYPAS
jgi:choice-of-anchor C domain-containing protein